MTTDRAMLDRELDAKVVRHAIWIALRSAQSLGWAHETDTLTALFDAVERRHDEAAEPAKVGS